MGDSVAVLNSGNILQRGTPEQIYHHPASLWLARFIGFSNQCEGTVENEKHASVSTAIGTFQLEHKEERSLFAGQQGTLVFKPGGCASKENRRRSIAFKRGCWTPIFGERATACWLK